MLVHQLKRLKLLMMAYVLSRNVGFSLVSSGLTTLAQVMMATALELTLQKLMWNKGSFPPPPPPPPPVLQSPNASSQSKTMSAVPSRSKTELANPTVQCTAPTMYKILQRLKKAHRPAQTMSNVHPGSKNDSAKYTDQFTAPTMSRV